MPPAQNPPTLATLVLALASLTALSAMITAWGLALTRLGRGEPLIPRREPRVVPWGAGSVVAAFLVCVLVNLIVVRGYVKAAGHVGSLSPRTQLVLIAANNLVLLAALPLMLRITSGARLGDLGLGTTPARADALRGLGAYLLVAPVIFAVMGAASRIWPPRAHPLQQMLEADASGGIALLAFVSGVVLAPAAEELLFRGVILGGLVRTCSGPGPAPIPPAEPVEPVLIEPLSSEMTVLVEDDENPWTAPRAPLVEVPRRPPAMAGWTANVLTSALFAALHFAQWPAPIPLFLLSLVLGWLYLRTGGLVAPFALHLTFNGMSTAVLYLYLLTGAKPPGEVARPAKIACRESRDSCRFLVLPAAGGGCMVMDPFPSSLGDHRTTREAGPGCGR